MIGRLELTPDELTKLVSAVLAANGFTHIHGLGLLDEAGQLVGYAKAFVQYETDFNEVKVYPKPDDDELYNRLQQMLSPDVKLPTLGSGNGGGTAAN